MIRALSFFSFAFLLFFNPLESQAATVSGKVVDSGNKPLGKIAVLLEHMENRNSDSPDTFIMRSETDNDGNFSFDLPPSEKHY
ncbi:MAG: carboxypeptidase-like regulatory domain-containing protein, partial [Victivallales bacterium]